MPPTSSGNLTGTLTETVIDVADQHTVLDHIGVPGPTPPAAPLPPPLPFASAAAYSALHTTIAKPGSRYADVFGAAAAVLDRLTPQYEDDKFWKRYVPGVSLGNYPNYAWKRLLPIKASLIQRINFLPRPGWTFDVSPKPRVILFPFGWSTWLSLRVVRPHSLAELADLVQHIFAGRCLQPDGTTATLYLDDYLTQVGDGVRVDVFGGSTVVDAASAELVAVVTALAKSGTSPAPGALTTADEKIMLSLVRPGTRPLTHPFTDHLQTLGEQLEYVLSDDRKRFLWLEHLLVPTNRNHDHLRCYHNNTFQSLVRAGHLQALIDEVVGRPHSPSLDELFKSALDQLMDPPYKNVILKEFIQDPVVQASIAAGQKRP